MRTALVLLATLNLAACGSPPPPVAPAPAAPVDATAAAPAEAASSAAPAADPPHQRSLDLASSCPNDVHLYFGEQPGDGKGTAAVLHTGTTMPVPRGSDGTVVVWVTDDKGAGLASVHVTKHMRHVRIDATCSKIDADTSR
jgi:hypothetical protein